MIVIPDGVRSVMQDHAFAWYPGECCGLLFATADGATALRAEPMDNIQDRLHAADPVEHPRTSRNGFQMNGLRMQRAVDAAAARGERLLAIFHSHIDCDAYFSREDTDMAAPPPERRPVDPTLWHVVMACYPEGIRVARAFRWDGSGYAGVELPGFARPAPGPLPLARGGEGRR